jgi:hypothetical protein
MRALPGVAPNSSAKKASYTDIADPIPDFVLKNPIVGEARRFDGTVAPGSWMLAQGQSIPITQNRTLFSVLGTSGGGDGKTTFKLPNPQFGYIIAVAGTLPTSPAALLQLGRHMTRQDSLGPNARPAAGPHVPEKVRLVRQERETAVAAARRSIASQVSARTGPVVRLAPDLQARIATDREQSRTAALAGLSPANRARVESLVESILGRRISSAEATRQMASALSAAEASTLLGVFDATQRTFRSGWAGMEHADPQQEAASYVMAIAFDRDQLYRLRTMPDAD